MLAIKGIAIGAANIVPGVSGATLAVIFRVYDQLIESINSLFSDTKRSLKFLIPLGLGMVAGILALVSALDFFLERYSLQAGAFIAGLMAGSVPFIYKLAVSQDAKKSYSYVIVLFSAAVIICMSIFVPTSEIYEYTEFSLSFAMLLFIGGILSAAALIIPGVSGAMVLIIFGIFPVAVHTLNLIREYLMTPLDFALLPPIFAVAAPIGLGLILGILLTSRLVAYLLKNHHGITYFVIIGLIFGSVFALFNDDATYQSHNITTPALVVFAALSFFVGLVVSLSLGKK